MKQKKIKKNQNKTSKKTPKTKTPRKLLTKNNHWKKYP